MQNFIKRNNICMFGRISSYFEFFPSFSFLDHSESIDMHYAYRKIIKKTNFVSVRKKPLFAVRGGWSKSYGHVHNY